MPRKSTAAQPTLKMALGLRTCDVNGKAYGGFQWPESGFVKCPDWSPVAECGNGLHALLWGCGDAGYLSTDADARWQVVAFPDKSAVDLNGKIKFPECEVVYSGHKKGAIDYLVANGAADKPVVYATITGGDGSTITGGYRSTITGGDKAEVKIRYWDGPSERYRTRIGYIGEDGLEPNKKYRLNNDARFEEVK